MTKIVYEPIFEITEEKVPELGDMKVGEKARAIINYKVVEKTKSFTVLGVKHVQLLPTKRSF